MRWTLHSDFCLHVTDVSLSDVAYQYTSTETFNDNIEMDIGWVEFASCAEGGNPTIINPQYTMDELLILAESAVTVKIMPSTDIPGVSETAAYTVKADLCSNPVYALNRGYTMSWVLDETTDPPVVAGLADTTNWIGATDMLANSCYGQDALGDEPSTLEEMYIYHACANVEGLNTQKICIYRDVIDIYLIECLCFYCRITSRRTPWRH